MRDGLRLLTALLLLALAVPAGAATDGVYHPYVNAREREFEYGLTWRGIGDDALTLQRASFGYSWTDTFSTEVYLLNEFPEHGGGRARAYEVAAKWELTEQGEYASDWGLMLEAEVGNGTGRHEVAASVLWEKELRHRWVAAANAVLEYEFGTGVDNEFETALRAQLRYLHSAALEPMLELYLDDIDYAAGPALQGVVPLAPGRQVRWQLGLLFGFNDTTPSTSLRASIELEF